MKELFPVYKNNKNLIYLDNAASSLKPQVVIDAINEYYLKYSCNIERGVYPISMEATKKVEEARKTVAEFINSKTNEVVFTRGASSSLNTVARAIEPILNDGDEVITSELEHHSNFLPWLNISKKKNIKLVFVPLTSDGHITVENFRKVLTDKTRVVALTHVSNVLGYTTPVKEIIKIAHERNIIVSIDGAQAIPHLKIDVKDLDVDFYSFSFHKMCGPTGLGVLYGKYELLNKLDPMEFGGEMNDEVFKDHFTYKEVPYKFETGTMPIAEIFGAKAALDFLNKIGMDFINKEGIRLRNLALNELKKLEDIEIYNDSEESSNIAFNIKNVHSHDSVTYICDDNICIRAGHHCAEPLHRFLNLDATLRASFYFYNDENDVKEFVNKIKNTIEFFKEVGYIG